MAKVKFWVIREAISRFGWGIYPVCIILSPFVIAWIVGKIGGNIIYVFTPVLILSIWAMFITFKLGARHKEDEEKYWSVCFAFVILGMLCIGLIGGEFTGEVRAEVINYGTWLLLGTAIGSLVTYRLLTKEKRIISSVRRDIMLLAQFHELNRAQYHKVISKDAKELVDDRRIVELYSWAEQLKNAHIPISGIEKIGPIRVVAEVIICQELLGLSHYDAMRALLNAKSLDDLRTLQSKNSN